MVLFSNSLFKQLVMFGHLTPVLITIDDAKCFFLTISLHSVGVDHHKLSSVVFSFGGCIASFVMGHRVEWKFLYIPQMST